MARRTVSVNALVLALALLSCHPASAAPESARTLQALCRAYEASHESADGARCASYVQGFLDGAAAGLAIREPRDAGREGRESWTERAARTRLGAPAMNRYSTAAATEFCLDDALPLAEVIRRLLRQLEADPPTADTPAAEAIRMMLLRSFPCDPR